jgi:Tol biopolymer transport system component
VVAGQGVLSVRDAKTAQVVGAPIVLPAGMTGSMPDWAPDAMHLVFASSINATPDRLARHLQGSSISWLSANTTGFSGVETIAASRGVVSNACVGRESFANPMFSPDSRWLTFSRGDCESEGDPTSEVILAAAARNAARYALTRANTQVGDKTLSRLQNGMPTWAPSHDTDIGWIAFTSVRDYGLVLTQGSQIGAQVRQLWIAAIDFKAIGNGDPSFPAFRLPAQDLDENNHRPFWTVDVLPPDWTPPIVR